MGQGATCSLRGLSACMYAAEWNWCRCHVRGIGESRREEGMGGSTRRFPPSGGRGLGLTPALNPR